MRVGGPFEVLMRSPVRRGALGARRRERGVRRSSGWSSTSSSRSPTAARSSAPSPRSISPTTLGGTRLDVTQSYTVLDPEAAWMAEGAPQGWAQTLDKLAEEVQRMQASRTPEPSVVHAAFTVAAHLRRAGRAGLAGAERRRAKAKWFGGPPGEWQRDRARHGLPRRRRRARQGPLDERRRLDLRRRLPRHRSERAHRLQLRHATRRVGRFPFRSPRWSSHAEGPRPHDPAR